MCVGCGLGLSWVCLRCVLDVSATTNTNTTHMDLIISDDNKYSVCAGPALLCAALCG